MDKKRLIKPVESDDIKGFEEFIDGQSADGNFLPRGVGGSTKKDQAGFEHFTFLTTDADRLMKLKNLLTEKLPFSATFNQSDKLIQDQKNEINLLKTKLFEVLDTTNSPYRKSVEEIFDSFFKPPKS